MVACIVKSSKQESVANTAVTERVFLELFSDLAFWHDMAGRGNYGAHALRWSF